MTATAKVKPSVVSAEALVGQDRDLFKQLLKESLQEVLEAEMTEVIGASSGERTELRSGYRAGYCSRSLVTRIGKLELRIPRDREGRFSITAPFRRLCRGRATRRLTVTGLCRDVLGKQGGQASQVID